MNYKILHFADLHLDASFAGTGLSGLEARKHREHLREALKRILDLAPEKEVNAITIAGDLFEQDRFTRDTGEFLISQFRRIAPVKVFIAPGNHDPFVAESLYRFLPGPANVTIFQAGEFTPIQLTQGLTLWGLAHQSPSVRKRLLENFKVAGSGKHILLFHGSDMSSVPDGKKTHAPFLPADLHRSEADLALIGHYHRAKLHRENGTEFLYPGSPEPLGFGEEDGHTIGLVTITDQQIETEIIPVNRWKFITGNVDISAAGSREDVKAYVENWLRKNADETTYAKIRLTGSPAPEIETDLEILQDQIQPLCTFCLLTDETHPGFDFADLAEEKTVRGEFVRDFLARIEAAGGAEKQKLEKALTYGLLAFAGKEIVRDEG